MNKFLSWYCDNMPVLGGIIRFGVECCEDYIEYKKNEKERENRRRNMTPEEREQQRLEYHRKNEFPKYKPPYTYQDPGIGGNGG